MLADSKMRTVNMNYSITKQEILLVLKILQVIHLRVESRSPIHRRSSNLTQVSHLSELKIRSLK